jgi:hypothetical protein
LAIVFVMALTGSGTFPATLATVSVMEVTASSTFPATLAIVSVTAVTASVMVSSDELSASADVARCLS